MNLKEENNQPIKLSIEVMDTNRTIVRDVYSNREIEGIKSIRVDYNCDAPMMYLEIYLGESTLIQKVS